MKIMTDKQFEQLRIINAELDRIKRELEQLEADAKERELWGEVDLPFRIRREMREVSARADGIRFVLDVLNGGIEKHD